jgi:hypothetical protein
MGRRKISGERKAQSITFSLQPKHQFMLKAIVELTKKSKSEFLQDRIEDFYDNNCKQEIKT